MKLLFCPLYATLPSVPVVLISAPPTCRLNPAFILATVNVPLVPLSTRENNVFGELSASFIVNVPLLPAVASVTIGDVLDNVNGDALDNVRFPDAVA